MCVHLQFSFEKATQALNFFAIKNNGHIDKLPALKLIFLADRYHLRKYARPITNAEYVAMQYGPVASEVKDIAEASSFLSAIAVEYSKKYLKISGNKIKSIGEVDKEEFSSSDIEALEYVWKKFGKMQRLVDYTHEYPEWKKHELSLKNKSSIRMDLLDFLEDAPKGIDNFQNLNQEEKKLIASHLKELSTVSEILG